MQATQWLRFCLLAMVFLFGLGGCDDDDKAAGSGQEPPPPPQYTLTITPALGLVRHAGVVVLDAAATVIGTGNTGASGVAAVTVSVPGPYVVAVEGNASAEYFDENLGAFVPFPAGEKIRALVPAGRSSLTVSALTDLAWALWKSEPGLPLNANNIYAANNAIRTAFANTATLPGLLFPVAVFPEEPAANSLDNTAEGMHAVLLAALADLGAGQSAPALAALRYLRADIGDGVFDGADSGTALAGPALYDPVQLPREFKRLIDIRRNVWGTGALQSAPLSLTSLQQPLWTGAAVRGITTPVSVSPGLSGTWRLRFTAAAGITTFASLEDGNLYEVSVTPDGMLRVGGTEHGYPYLRARADGTLDPVLLRWAFPGGIEFALGDRQAGLLSGISVYDTQELQGNQGRLVGTLGFDLSTWDARSSAMTAGLRDVAWGNGRFVAVGDERKILYSSDGLDWSQATPPVTPGTWHRATSVAFDGTRFVIVGDTADHNLMPPMIATSPDGIDWTYRAWSPQNDITEIRRVVAADGTLSAVGKATVLTSTDSGTTWSVHAQALQEESYAIAAGDGRRVVLGSSAGNGMPMPHVLLDDGSQWSVVITYVMEGHWYEDVIRAGNHFLAIGTTRPAAAVNSRTVTALSSDGARWDVKGYTSAHIPADVTFSALGWDGSHYFAAGHGGGLQRIYVSVDGVNWRSEYQGAVAGDPVLTGIASSPDTTVVVGPMRYLVRNAH